MSDTIEKYRALVKKIYDATNSRKIGWGYDDENDRLEAILGSNKIFVFNSENYKSEPVVIFSIFGPDGSMLEKFNDDDVKGMTYSGKSAYQLMLHVFNVGKRQATGADEALDKLLKDLDDLFDPT